MPNKIELTNDGPLNIAVGRHRRETSWKNKEWQWSDLVTKLSETHCTAETQAEYLAAKKPRQDEIKDIGGYVGGYLTGGRRKSASVFNRSIITLDLDYATADFWSDYVLYFNNAAVLYSTHKHSPQGARYRLIIMLDREVRPDEYEAISRWVAGQLDIELFDPTTFQPERLMYWPSTSKDGQYVFEYQDGPFLSADAVLANYHDWRDSSEWPVSVKVDKILQRNMVKQGDPLEKPGVIGAFCRTYTVHEVIELFLSDVYEACDVENRYTYKGGSTAAGLVTYDDKYAYSHHGTDPTSGKLCNAFDLVRLHKFGLKDEDVREGTPGNKLPSYLLMTDFATKDVKVKTLLVSEKISDAQADFEGYEPTDIDDGPVDETWKEKLEVDRKGNIYNSIDNILLILENDRHFYKRIAFDDFEKCEVATQNLPWRQVTGLTRRLIDKDDASIRHYLEKTYGISNATKTKDAMQVLSIKTAFHPVRDYLNALKWDGIKRLDSLLIDYMGAIDTPYTRTVTRKHLVAAVARVYDPGVKYDHVLTFVGEQGLAKSTLVAKLGRQWFSDSFSTIEGKESFEQLQGVWLVEIAELAGLAKAEVEKIKHFITKRDDRYRVAFGHRTEKFPRQCVFFATTNKKYFLRDPTGDRRYWPVLVHQIKPTKSVFNDLTETEIGQIWAEAVALYRKGETLYLPEAMANAAKQIQKDHTEEHPWTGLVLQYLDTKLPENWQKMTRYERLAFLQGGDDLTAEGTVYRDRVCVLEIWVEALNQRNAIDERGAETIRNIMRNVDGWEEETKQLRYGIFGVQRRGYKRVNVADELIEKAIKKGVPQV